MSSGRPRGGRDALHSTFNIQHSRFPWAGGTRMTARKASPPPAPPGPSLTLGMTRVGVAIAAAAAAIVLLALCGAAFGHPPGELLGILAAGSIGSSFAVQGTLLKSVPLLLTGLSVA